MIYDKLRDSLIIDTHLLANNSGINQREIRRYISQLMAKREALFIPVRDKIRPGVYKRAELMEIDDVRAYYREMRSHVKSVYFDRMLPMADYLEEKDREELYAHLDLFKDLEELENDS